MLPKEEEGCRQNNDEKIQNINRNTEKRSQMREPMIIHGMLGWGRHKRSPKDKLLSKNTVTNCKVFKHFYGSWVCGQKGHLMKDCSMPLKECYGCKETRHFLSQHLSNYQRYKLVILVWYKRLIVQNFSIFLENFGINVVVVVEKAECVFDRGSVEAPFLFLTLL